MFKYILNISNTPVTGAALGRTEWAYEYLVFRTKKTPTHLRSGMQIRKLGNAPILLVDPDPIYDTWDAELEEESIHVILDEENLKKLDVSDIEMMLKAGWKFED